MRLRDKLTKEDWLAEVFGGGGWYARFHRLPESAREALQNAWANSEDPKHWRAMLDAGVMPS